MQKVSEKEAIDFVMPWVDGSDPEWRRDKNKWLAILEGRETGSEETMDASEERYRDWGLLKYWFRGVERYCPWVRKVHFITYGHLPDWMNVECPKLHIVRHEDYIPEEFIPVFNCTVLEVRLHKIPGLAEKFVYFNDDCFLLDDISPSLFFRGGKPCDMLAFQPVPANPENPVMSHLLMNNMLVLSKYFRKRENVRQQPGHYFKIGYPPLYFFYNLLEMAFPQYTGLYTVHGPTPFLKETYREVWEKEGKALTEMSFNKFRSSTDLSQYLFREWQKLRGNFVPANLLRDFQYFEVSSDNRKLIRTIKSHKKKIICINDARLKDNFEQVQKNLQMAFEQILPEKSMFEK